MPVPRSAKVIDKVFYPMAKFTVGTKLHQCIDLLRELHTSLSTSGAMNALLNELRTKCHTAGDIFTLANALRALFIANGTLADIILDTHDQACNACLVNPDWKQNTGGGGNTQLENGTAIDCISNGLYKAAHYAATQDVAVTASANTGASEYKAVTLSLTGAGALTQTASAASGSAPVTAPRPPSGEVGVGVIQIPNSYTAGTTTVQTAWFTQGFPRRVAVYTPITTAAVSAVTASALASAPTAQTPDALPDTDV